MQLQLAPLSTSLRTMPVGRRALIIGLVVLAHISRIGGMSNGNEAAELLRDLKAKFAHRRKVNWMKTA